MLERLYMELLGKTRDQLREYCLALGEPAYRAAQLYHALYAERKFEFAGMTNLPAALREKLAREATITLPSVKQRYVSTDGSVRFLLLLDTQKPASVEAVYMPSERRQTICISTQGWLRCGLSVLPDGSVGINPEFDRRRNHAQVLLPLNEVPKKRSASQTAHDSNEATLDENPGESGDEVQTNVVLMGQGEPLLNFDNMIAALRILLDEEGVGLSPKRVNTFYQRNHSGH